MTLKNGLRLLLVLSCLSSPGCAWLGQHYEKPKPPERELTKEEKEDKYMNDLARDLHLYTDG